MNKKEKMKLIFGVMFFFGPFALSIFLLEKIVTVKELEKNDYNRSSQREISDITSEKETYELCFWLNRNIDEIQETMSDVEWSATNESISGHDGCIVLYYDNDHITEILLKNCENAECPWTLWGIKPGMNLEDVLNSLDKDGIVLERHNMQWYASGILLESEGIKRLEWDPDEQISYLRAVVDTSNLEKLSEFSFEVEERELNIHDEEKNINVLIKYPLFDFGEEAQVAKSVNENIQTVLQEILQMYNVSNAQNVVIDADYVIANVESECLSVRWSGICVNEDGEQKVDIAITCNLIEEGKIITVTEIGLSTKTIIGEIAWRTEIDEDSIREQLIGNQHEFYVTPLHLVVKSVNKDTQEVTYTSLWR